MSLTGQGGVSEHLVQGGNFMNGLVMLLIAAVALLTGYVTYGRFLARKWGIDPNSTTPAKEFEDGQDYVPSPPSVVFGHHFTSITGAGPINGPIIAAMFGWVPVLLWILLGSIFMGAVMDFASMYASIRSKGKSIGYIIEVYIGRTGKKLFLIFVWLFSILVLAAFTDIVANTFNGFSADGSPIAANGGAATTSIMFIGVAVLFGFYMKSRKPKGLEGSLIAIGLLVACIAIGLQFPVFIARDMWIYIVLAYAILASVTPVWALLVPRDFINTFLLIAIIASAFLGIIFTAPVVNLPAFTAFTVRGSHLFPMLFVTVACGAISGFHSLIASGTVSKQVSNERHMLPVAYGGMLLEALLAVIALITVGAITINGQLPQGITTPIQIFAHGVAGFLGYLRLPTHVVFTVMTLGISAFALTTLDSVSRIARMTIQEFFADAQNDGKEPSALVKFITNKYVATLLTCILSYGLAKVGYQNIWPLFGSTNQLTGALSLVACSVFMKKTKRQGVMLWIPMGALLIITLTALSMVVYGNINLLVSGGFVLEKHLLQLLFGILLLALGVILAVQGIKKLTEKTETTAKTEAAEQAA